MSELRGPRGPSATRLGAYEVIRPLARGGMAQLLLARMVGPQGFEKLVVLKRILPQYAEDPRLERLFLDEAKLVAGLDHPHIANVYDMGTLDGSYFFTMEHVHGPDLRTLQKRLQREGGALPIEHAVMIARDVASALHYAHERRGPDGESLGVVHRDVSPSNVLVSYEGVPKLIDFGIAKSAASSLRTQTGALKGKVSYMSPEQARGKRLDRRSDVYSLGIVLWEMIAGRRLHERDNDLETLEQIIQASPPSLAGTRGCPPELARIVERALAREPDARYPTAQAMQLALEESARELRLALSRVSLSGALHALFADELRAWNDARREAPTVTNALAAPPAEAEAEHPEEVTSQTAPDHARAAAADGDTGLRGLGDLGGGTDIGIAPPAARTRPPSLTSATDQYRTLLHPLEPRPITDPRLEASLAAAPEIPPPAFAAAPGGPQERARRPRAARIAIAAGLGLAIAIIIIIIGNLARA